MAAIPRPFTLLSAGRGAGGVFYGLNNQTITGDANGAWAVAANGTNQNITLTPSGTGSVVLSAALKAIYGGTGQTGFTTGDILYASSSTVLSKLAGGTAGFVLTAQGAGVAPIYAAVAGAGLGDFSTGGPVSTDGEIVRFDGVGGLNGQLSGVKIGDVASTNITITPIGANDLTLSGGSTGASLVLGQGTNGNVTITPKGTGLTTTPKQLAIGTSTGGESAHTLQITCHSDLSSAIYFSDAASSGRLWGIGPGVGTGVVTNFGWYDYTASASLMQLTTNKNLLIGGTTDISGTGGLKVFGTTAATNTTSGALTVAGGAGIAGAGWFGGIVTSTSGSSGYGLNVEVGSGVAAKLRLYQAGAAEWYVGMDASSGVFRVFNGSDRFTIANSNGNAAFTSTTEATTGGAGSLVTSGGIYAAKKIVGNTDLLLVGKVTTYNNLTTAGNGLVSVQGAGRATAQTAANASVATYTVGASDASFVVSANVLVTTSSAEAFTVTVTYTDEGNTERTITLNFQLLAGTIGTGIAFANGAVPYEGLPVHIRAKAATTITVKTAAGGTYTGCTYNVEGVITKLQ